MSKQSEVMPNTIVINGQQINTDCIEYKTLKGIIFHISHKLNMVIGLNEQEKEWLRTMGAQVETDS